MPPITYPAELPVSQRRDEVARVIRDHQVVVIAGETGSGKTTQIPKICLELGRGVDGREPLLPREASQTACFGAVASVGRFVGHVT